MLKQLKYIFMKMLNGIIETGDWPTGLKAAIVKPPYRGRKDDGFKSYRPISILSCVSPVLLEETSFKSNE